jgi:hypothetical protein
MVAPQRVEGAMYDQADQLLAQRDPTSLSLPLCHPRTDIHVAHNVTASGVEHECKYIGWLVVAFMLRVEATHGVAAEKGDRDETLLTLLLQNGLNHTPHQGAG